MKLRRNRNIYESRNLSRRRLNEDYVGTEDRIMERFIQDLTDLVDEYLDGEIVDEDNILIKIVDEDIIIKWLEDFIEHIS